MEAFGPLKPAVVQENVMLDFITYFLCVLRTVRREYEAERT